MSSPRSANRFARCVATAATLAMLALSGCAGPRTTAEPEPALAEIGHTWIKVFDDEFNGTTLNRDNWDPYRYSQDYGGDAPFGPDIEQAWFNSKNVAVHDGNLVLTVQPGAKTLHGVTYNYNTGMVQSAAHFTITPGTFIEARISVPNCDACWPAFWTLATDANHTSELDILEYFNSAAQQQPDFTFHPSTGNPTGPIPYGEPGVDYRGGFHVYGMYWDGAEAVPYLDGKPYDVGATHDMTTLSQSLILNLSVLNGGSPAPGSQMLVDWVRAWRPAN